MTRKDIEGLGIPSAVDLPHETRNSEDCLLRLRVRVIAGIRTNENKPPGPGKCCSCLYLAVCGGLASSFPRGKGVTVQAVMSTDNFRSYKRGAIVANNESQSCTDKVYRHF